MPPHIIKFINENFIMSLASWSETGPYICNCFYIYVASENDLSTGLVFASDPGTRHGQEMQLRSNVAVAIHHTIRDVASIQGVQMTGQVKSQRKSSNNTVIDWKRLQAKYVQTFPESRHMPDLPLWFFKIDWLKYTDNSIQFGHKEIWQRNA